MERVQRRKFLPLLFLAVPAWASQPEAPSVRGTLTTGRDGKPAIRTPQGLIVHLDGDLPTVGVLKDARLRDFDFEALGHFLTPDRFAIDPIHKRAMFVHKDGKRLMVTYWCDVCGIRSYTPGPCWCCQEETVLDLRESV